jgi:hypothetical protein
MGDGGESRGTPAATVEYLKDWELHGAMWRAVEVSDERAVIELCSCSGEPMDLVEGDDAQLIEYVRAHRRSS